MIDSLYLNPSLILEETNLYLFYKLIRQYSESYSLYRPAPSKVLSTDTKDETVEENAYEKIIKRTIVKYLTVPQGEVTQIIQLNPIPTTLVKLGAEIGISRQTLSNYKGYLEGWKNRGEMRLHLGNNYLKLSIDLLDALMEQVDGISIEDKNKSFTVMLYIITSIYYFQNNFCRSYDKIGEECGVSRDFVGKTIRKLIDTNVIEIKHKGNNIQHFATSYKFTESFKMYLKQEDNNE